MCPEGNTVLFAETATSVPFCQPSSAHDGRKGTRGARREAAIFRASGDDYATVWAQQVRHADGGALREASGGEGAQPGLFLKLPSVSSARSARMQHHSMHRLTWRAGKKKASVDHSECWIFEKRRCDEEDGPSAMKHLACKRRSAGFYSPRCRIVPAASCLSGGPLAVFRLSNASP